MEEELQVLCRARAICEYVPDDTSQEGDIHFLSFVAGDVIDVLEQDESGWWEGVLNGAIGVFPGSYVQVLEWYGAEEEQVAGG